MQKDCEVLNRVVQKIYFVFNIVNSIHGNEEPKKITYNTNSFKKPNRSHETERRVRKYFTVKKKYLPINGASCLVS